MDVLELTRTLVNLPSISNEEGRVTAYVADRLKAEGWHVKTQEVPFEGEPSDPSALPRLNVLAQPSEKPVKVIFTTHLDTVPPFIPITETEEALYGRGTCDAKGIFAAMWCAAEALRQEGIDEVGLLAVVGEETNSLGAKMVPALLPKVDWIVNGEPTEMVASSGGKGFMGLVLKAEGKACHSAYPEQGHSALHSLNGALHRLITRPMPSDPKFGETTVNIGTVSGGLAPNVLAPSAEATVAIRLAAPAAQVLEAVQEALGDEVSYALTSQSEPHAIFAPSGMPTEVVRFSSDIPNLSKIGRPLMFGPGSIHDAHTQGEYVRKADLKRAVEVYAKVAKQLLSMDPKSA